MQILIYNAVLLIIEAFCLGTFGATGLKSGKTAQTSFLVLAFLQLFVLHAFLDPSTMPDLPAYTYVYKRLEYISAFTPIHMDSGNAKMETGWMIFNKALCMIWNNPRLLLLVTSFGIVGGYFVTIKKYSPMIGLSVILYYFTSFPQSLFVLRQHLAVALCLLAIPTILNRKQVLFLLIVLVAFSLHKTAVLFLPIYYLYNLKINRKFWIYFLVGISIATVLMQFVAAWIYANTWYRSYATDNFSNFTPLAIQSLAIFLYFYCSKWNVNGIENEEKLFFLMGMVGVVLGVWGILFSGFSSRLALYYSVSNIFLLPIAIRKVPDQIQRFIITTLCIVCFGAQFYSTLGSKSYIGYHLMSL